MMFWLWLLWLPQQITWYEAYEDAEKAFGRQKYDQTIALMETAVRLNPEAKRNAFTRAVQKIEYKPYYYLALAYYRQDQLEQAYLNARKAFAGEVVAQNPKLQHDLVVIYTDYRNRYDQRQAQLEARAAMIDTQQDILSKLVSGDLAGAQQAYENLAPDQQKQLNSLGQMIQQQLANLSSRQAASDSITRRIGELLDDGELQGARAYIDAFRSQLSNDDARNFEARLQELETQQQAAEALLEEPEAEPAEPLPPSPDFQAEIDQMQGRLASLSDENNRLETVLQQARNQNARLQSQLQQSETVPPPPQEPRVLINLARAGTRIIQVSGRIFVNEGLKKWELNHNGSPIKAQVDQAGSHGTFKVSAQVEDAPWGLNTFELKVNDQLNQQALINEQFTLTRPWFLKPMTHIAIAAALTGAFLWWLLLSLQRRRKARLAHFNPYIAGSPVLESKMFFGREALMQRILNMVHKNCLMIYGDRRIGKTSLLYQIKATMQASASEQYGFYPVYIDLQGVVEEDLFHHIAAEIFHQHTEWQTLVEGLIFQEENANYKSRQFSKDLKQIIQHLQQQDQRHVLIVLLMDEVDAINEFSEKTNQKLRGIFMREFAEHLSCIMAGIHLKKEWESAGSPWYNFFEEIPMSPIDQQAARELITNPVKGIFRWDQEAVDRILETSSGRPYTIQKMCVSIINKKLSEHRFRIRLKDVNQAIYAMKEETEKINTLS